MDFSDALRAVRDGKKVTRPLWLELDGRVGSYIELADIPPLGEVLICQTTTGKALFACSQRDILAEDWEIVSD